MVISDLVYWLVGIMKTPALLLSLSLVISDLISAGKENKRQTRPLDDVSYEKNVKFV